MQHKLYIYYLWGHSELDLLSLQVLSPNLEVKEMTDSNSFKGTAIIVLLHCILKYAVTYFNTQDICSHGHLLIIWGKHVAWAEHGKHWSCEPTWKGNLPKTHLSLLFLLMRRMILNSLISLMQVFKVVLGWQWVQLPYTMISVQNFCIQDESSSLKSVRSSLWRLQS